MPDSDHDFPSDEAREAYLEAERRIEAWEEGALDLSIKALKLLPKFPTKLSNLLHLNLNSTQVSDLSPLSGLSSLQNLHLVSTQVSDLSPLSGLGNLQNLDLNSTQVSDLSPLSGLSSLQHLDLNSTQVGDLSPLSGLSSLQRLDLSSTQVGDLSPLSGLSSLQHLNFDDTQVSNLDAIAAFRIMVTEDPDMRGSRISFNPWGRSGLSFVNCRNLSVKLQEIAKIRSDSERTLKAIDWVRRDLGLSSVDQWLEEPDRKPPPVPDHHAREADIRDAEHVMELVQTRVALQFRENRDYLRMEAPELGDDAGAAEQPATKQLHQNLQ